MKRLKNAIRKLVSAPRSQFHFVEDYERHIDRLIAKHPLPEAMSLAVGGHWEEFGPVLAEVLVQNGLKDGMSLVDLGCGSGRLAKAIGDRLKIEYLGIDVVQRLLDYAASVSPRHFKFRCHQELSIPAEPASADMICAFSLFTHLLHEETCLYLQDAHRILRPGGKVVMSFLEFALPEHWLQFEGTMHGRKRNTRQPLNMFIERGAIDVWCSHLGFERTEFVPGTDTRWGGKSIGQSLAVLRKSA
ncbi:MAG: class I SAM-dependent methyltransferase [Chthoniobacteraceae bacterium]